MTKLSDIDQQIADLQKQKEQLIQQEKTTALDKVNNALKELNALGFNYSLTSGEKAPTKRRSGVRQSVQAAIQAKPGITRAELLDTLDVKGDKSGENSVSNALSALKKAGQITGEGGAYEPA